MAKNIFWIKTLKNRELCERLRSSLRYCQKYSAIYRVIKFYWKVFSGPFHVIRDAKILRVFGSFDTENSKIIHILSMPLIK